MPGGIVVDGSPSPTPTPTPSPTPTPIVLTGTGGLFTRIGSLGGLLDAINTQRGETIPNHVTAVGAQYLTSNQSVVSGIYSSLASYQTASGNFMPSIRSMAIATLTQMVNAAQLLPTSSLSSVMAYLISDMLSTGDTVNACEISGSISAAGTNVGNPVVVVSLRGVDGLELENIFDELIVGVVTNDSSISTSLAGIEPIFFSGQAAISDAMSWQYPEGSGAALNVTAISPLVTPGGGTANWLINGSMEAFSVANVPTSWHVTTGIPGTDIYQTMVSGTYYDGVSGFKIIGDGATNVAIRQQFSQTGVTGDMRASLSPNVQIAVNLFLKVTTTPSTGVLRVAMTDSLGTVIDDDSGVPNSYEIDLTALTAATWTSGSWAFRSPRILPSETWLELKLTTALENTMPLFIDRVAVAQMSRLYVGGPYVSVFSGSDNMLKGDTFFIDISNNYTGEFQRLFDRIYSMKSMGLMLPSATGGGETIPDNLIV